MTERIIKRVIIRRGWELQGDGTYQPTTIALTQDEIDAGVDLDFNWTGDDGYVDTVIALSMPMPPKPVTAETAPEASVVIDDLSADEAVTASAAPV